MKNTVYLGLLASLTILAGCATEGRATGGDSVRAIVASQIIPPQPRVDRGIDGRAAAAAYGNYQNSYASPVAQGESTSFGRK